MNNTDQSYNSSDNLENLHSEAERLTARLEELKQQRGEAVNERAQGGSGAAERLAEIHTEQERAQRELEDVEAAQKVETQRLQDAHTQAVQDAHLTRRELAEERRHRVAKDAAAVDKAAAKLFTTIDQVEDSGKALSRLMSNAAGTDMGTRAKESLRTRLENWLTTNKPQAHALVDQAPSRAGVQESTRLPESLDEMADDKEALESDKK